MITTSRMRTAAAFVAVLLAFAPAAWDSPNIYDEGVVVFGALRLLAGDVPHRDFWTMYPPGVFLLFAGVFELFGRSLFVERAASLILNALLIALCFESVDRRAGLVRAAWVAGLAAMWIAAARFNVSPVVPALLIAVLAARVAARAAASGDARRGAVAGLMVAVMALFRHDLAVYSSAAILLVLAGATWRRAIESGLRTTVAFAAVLTATTGAFVLGLVAAAGAAPVTAQLVTFPLFEFAAVRELPYPSPALAIVPPLLSTLALVFAVRAFTTHRARMLEAAMLAATGLLFTGQSLVRSDFSHVVPSFVIGLTAFGAALPAVRWRARRVAAHTAVVLALALFTVTAVPPGEPPATHPFSLDRAAGLRSPANPRPYEQAILLVRDLAAAGEPIFVGNDRHDRIFINDVLFYALADRPSATRYHELHPGVATTAPVQREIIQELEARQVQVVVIRTERHPPESANASSQSSGVTLLDDHIRMAFESIATFEDYDVRKRRQR
jgi:hypothetical protein